jgi:hypothetical protein
VCGEDPNVARCTEDVGLRLVDLNHRCVGDSSQDALVCPAIELCELVLLDLNLLPMNVDSERFSEDLDDGPRRLLVRDSFVDEPASQVATVLRADGQVLLEEPRLPTRSTPVLRGSVFSNPPLDIARAKAKIDLRLLEALVSVRTLDAASGAARRRIWRRCIDALPGEVTRFLPRL